jgi:curli biogenesis system outer membrane secretion channel CsgG
MKKIKTLLACLLFANFAFPQNTSNISGNTEQEIQKAYIIALDDGVIYVDLTAEQTKKGDKYKIIKEGGFIIHPVTKEKIKKKDKISAILEITETEAQYSIAKVQPVSAYSLLNVGDEIFTLEKIDIVNNSNLLKKSIAVYPVKTTMGEKGMLGNYVSDLLSQKFYETNKFKVIDRDMLSIQMNEKHLQEFVNEGSGATMKQTSVIDYYITGTLYEPDVVRVQGGVPLKGILQLAELASGYDMGSEYASNVKTEKLKAAVKITLRVVDVQTGEILFSRTAEGVKEGQSQIDFEQGVLGGSTVQGGASGFMNSITGQAVNNAIIKLVADIGRFITGDDIPNNMLTTTNTVRYTLPRTKQASTNNAKITEFKSENNKNVATLDKGKNAGFKQNGTYNLYLPIYETSNITKEENLKGYNKQGKIKIDVSEPEVSIGTITFNENYKVDNFDHKSAEIHPYRGKGFTFALGYGPSYGRLGMRLQWRVGANGPVGLHLQLGHPGENAQFPGVGAGIKFFLYRDFYVNAQIGIFGVDTFYHDYDDNFSYTGYSAAAGPSFLIGGDWMFGQEKGVGLNTGMGIAINIDEGTQFIFDLGLIFRFK